MRRRSLVLVGLFVAIVAIWYVVAPPAPNVKVPIPAADTNPAPEAPKNAEP